MTPVHEPFCAGAHTDEITCRDATDWRASVAADPWTCTGATRSGYHRFDEDFRGRPPDATCVYDGCDRTWGELVADWRAAHPGKDGP